MPPFDPARLIQNIPDDLRQEATREAEQDRRSHPETEPQAPTVAGGALDAYREITASLDALYGSYDITHAEAIDALLLALCRFAAHRPEALDDQRLRTVRNAIDTLNKLPAPKREGAVLAIAERIWPGK